jgi:hypothetical protein
MPRNCGGGLGRDGGCGSCLHVVIGASVLFFFCVGVWLMVVRVVFCKERMNYTKTSKKNPCLHNNSRGKISIRI